MSVLAAGCWVGVNDDGAPRVGVHGQRLRRSPGHGGRAAASENYRTRSGDRDRADGDFADGRKVRPVEVGAVIVHVHRNGEHLTFADDLGRNGSDER